MRPQRRRYIYPITLDEEDLKALERVVGKLGGSKADAIRGAIKYYAEYVRGLEVVKVRQKVPRKQAKREILGYLKGKDRVYADEIADALNLDFRFVNELLLELWQEGVVEEV